jgi:hypothetical protein
MRGSDSRRRLSHRLDAKEIWCLAWLVGAGIDVRRFDSGSGDAVLGNRLHFALGHCFVGGE